MAKLTPTEFAEKQGRRLKGSIEDIRAGLLRVTENPCVKAAGKKEKMKARINEAIDTGKWDSRLKAVGLEEWRSKAIDKGLGRISSGIDGAMKKVEDFAAQLLPYQDSVRAKIKAMPDMTLEDRINRATAFIREMAKFRKK